MTPGEAEQAEHELRRAWAVLRDAHVLLGTGSGDSAANRLYYAAFHAVRAALTVTGRHSRTHSGQITLFEEVFGRAPILHRLLDLRSRADYAMEEFSEPLEKLQAEAAAARELIERCAAIVAEARADGPDEPDPPPDH